MKWHLDRPDLLVADVPWEQLIEALRSTSGERFEVLRTVSGDWWAWMYQQHPENRGRTWSLVAGGLDGRSYCLGDGLGVGSTADRVAALAAATGRLVLGYNYDDTTGSEFLVAARGTELLRFSFETNWGDHSEGDTLAGEEHGIGAILEAFGFDPDAWLERGTVLRVTWTMLDRDEDPVGHQRLYFGPLRQRVDHIERAALEEFEDSDRGDDEP